MAELIRDAGGRSVPVSRAALGRKAAPDPAPASATTSGGGAEVLAARLEEIADRARRLMVYDRQPHRFHEEKDGVYRDLMRIAQELRVRVREAGQCGRGR